MGDYSGGHRAAVRDHYNLHVDPTLSTQEALQRRAKGEAAPLKKFHNDIKRSLLKRFAMNAPSLLDLCCGRGGDMQKWFECKIGYVKGVDIAEMEVLEAARRFNELLDKQQNCKMAAEFEACGELGESGWSDGNQYDVVTCMFAMHYFFEGERKLKQFLANVANSLAPGGHFVGTIPDGKRVLNYLHGRVNYNTRMLQLKKLWKGDQHEVQPFGHQYLCAITDTVTEARGDSKGSVEFLTFFHPILVIAARLGLEPVANYEDRQLARCFDEQDVDQGAPFKHFRPYFPNSDPSLEAASSIFVAFVFKKTHAPPPRPPPSLEDEEGTEAMADDEEAVAEDAYNGYGTNQMASLSDQDDDPRPAPKRAKPSMHAASLPGEDADPDPAPKPAAYGADFIDL